MQAGGRLPCTKTDTPNCFSRFARGVKRDSTAITRNRVTRFDQARDLHLYPLQRRVHPAYRSACTGLFSEHVPGLERLAQFQLDPVRGYRPDFWEAKLQVRSEPLCVEFVTGS